MDHQYTNENDQGAGSGSSLSPTPGLVLGIIGVVFAALSLIPCLGAVTIWIACIVTLVGLVLAIVAKGKAGIVLNSIALLVCIIAIIVQAIFWSDVYDKTKDAYNDGLKEAIEKELRQGTSNPSAE